MPFGPYRDHDDCVAKNRDKQDPDAYCAEVRRRIEGGEPVLDVLLAADTAPQGQRLLKDIIILTTGQLEDSEGQNFTLTREDLASVARSFSLGVPTSVPIKLGHTSNEFNSKIATALGIPVEILTGDSKNNGQARLGEVIALHSNGSLRGDVRLHPKVAELIQQGLFTGISGELAYDYEVDGAKYPLVLSALSLLGAQRPAVKGSSNLSHVRMFTGGT